jgi:hypothetical protein
MHKILCVIGIHMFDKWINVLNRDGTVYVIKTAHIATAPDEFAYKQEMAQSRLCGCCGSKTDKKDCDITYHSKSGFQGEYDNEMVRNNCGNLPLFRLS